MITEESLEFDIALASNSTQVTFSGEKMREVLRLAKLGMWAKNYGFPALEHTRGQWIHSVNAQECLDAIKSFEEVE